MIGFPLLIIPFAIYNMIAFLTPGVSWTGSLYTFHLKSGLDWSPTAGDALLAFSLLMLLFEFIKSARYGKSLVEHFLALLLACGAAAEFVMIKEAANSVFLLLVVICFIDLFAGFASALRRARRAVVVEPEPVAYVEPAPRHAPVVRPEPPAPPPGPPPAPRMEPFVKVEPVQKVEH